MNSNGRHRTGGGPLGQSDSGSPDLYREFRKLLLDLDLKIEDVAREIHEPSGTVTWAFRRGKSRRAAGVRRVVSRHLANLQKRLVTA
jgi:hypothetical protein